MVDSKENYKFDLGTKGLTNKILRLAIISFVEILMILINDSGVNITVRRN